MTTTETTPNIPADNLAQVVLDYHMDGATSVTTTQQANGNFTVTAVYGDPVPAPAPPTPTPPTPLPVPPVIIATEAVQSISKPGIPWTVEINGADLVVRKVKVTAFGGAEDVRCHNDDGHTESGIDTATQDANGNWVDTYVAGCALPVSKKETATKGSPLAFTQRIPWHTKVRFWAGDDESSGVVYDLLDNGPDVSEYPSNAGDLTPAAAQFFNAKMPFNRFVHDFEQTLSYRVIGGAQYIS
jgi:hypothetical protein